MTLAPATATRQREDSIFESPTLTVTGLTPTEDPALVGSLLERTLPTSRAARACSTEMVRSLVQAGNLVALARVDGEPVGAAVALMAFQDSLEARLELVVVDPAWRARGVGRSLLAHVRRWATAFGASRVVWTFDPCNGSEAFLSLQVAQAELAGYLSDQPVTLRDLATTDPQPGDRLLAVLDLGRDPSSRPEFSPIATLRIPSPDAPPEQHQTFRMRLRDLLRAGHPLDVDSVGRYLLGAAPQS